MSNRGRQNIASFLSKELFIDWRWGANTLNLSSLIMMYIVTGEIGCMFQVLEMILEIENSIFNFKPRDMTLIKISKTLASRKDISILENHEIFR